VAVRTPPDSFFVLPTTAVRPWSAATEGPLEDLPTDTTGRREDRELQQLPHARHVLGDHGLML
jgi:hypothetical protein